MKVVCEQLEWVGWTLYADRWPPGGSDRNASAGRLTRQGHSADRCRKRAPGSDLSESSETRLANPDDW